MVDRKRFALTFEQVLHVAPFVFGEGSVIYSYQDKLYALG